MNKQQWFELSQIRAQCLQEYFEKQMKQKVDDCLQHSKLNDVVSYAAMLEILGEHEKLNQQLIFTCKKFPIGFVNQLKILDRSEQVEKYMAHMQSFRYQQEGYTNYAFGYLGPYFEEMRQHEKLKNCETGR